MTGSMPTIALPIWAECDRAQRLDVPRPAHHPACLDRRTVSRNEKLRRTGPYRYSVEMVNELGDIRTE